MNIQTSAKFIFALLLLTACSQLSATMKSPSATDIDLPTPTKISITQPSPRTIDDLRAIIYASNPESPHYDPKSTAYAEFPEAVKQLSTMGSNAVDAAGDLAIAITFPRQDSYLAAQALISLGPDITATTIVTLFANLDSNNLHKQKPEALINSIILLSSTGNRASCAVGNIGPLLWNSDSRVRSAAAFALERITEQDLVASQAEVEITPSFLANSISADEPKGNIVETARQWWDKQGSKTNWHPSYGICDP